MYLPTMKKVLANSAFVKINLEKIDRWAEKIAHEDFPVLPMRSENLPEKDDDWIQFICISTALNFCFTDPHAKEKFEARINGEQYKGSQALNACLTYAINHEWPLLKHSYLKKITLRELEAVFRGNIKIPLAGERARILNEIGHKLDKYDGSFANLFQENNYQAFGCSKYKGIIPTLCKEFPLAYEDVAYWPYGQVNGGPVSVYFRKKAQLLCILYNNRAITSNGVLEPIKDIDKIGAIADYQAPRPFVDEGALEYSESLSKKIRESILLPGSREEIEIRANYCGAAEIFRDKINELRVKMNPPKTPIFHSNLDPKCWLLGRKSSTPQHLTPTTAY